MMSLNGPSRQIAMARAVSDSDEIAPATPVVKGGDAGRDHEHSDQAAHGLQQNVERTDGLKRMPSGHDAARLAPSLDFKARPASGAMGEDWQD